MAGLCMGCIAGANGGMGLYGSLLASGRSKIVFSLVGAARQRPRQLSRQSAWRHPLSCLATANGGTIFSSVLLAGSS